MSTQNRDIATRGESWSRPLICHGREISRVHLHDGNKVFYTADRGWLEHVETPEKVLSCLTKDVLTINKQFRLARKCQLEKRDDFVLRFADSDCGYFKEGYALYIYIPAGTVEWKVVEQLSNDGLTLYRTRHAEIYLPCEVQSYRSKGNGEEGLEYFAEKVDRITIQGSRQDKPTELGEKMEAIAKEFNDILPSRCDVYASHIQKLLEKFEITRRAA